MNQFSYTTNNYTGAWFFNPYHTYPLSLSSSTVPQVGTFRIVMTSVQGGTYYAVKLNIQASYAVSIGGPQYAGYRCSIYAVLFNAQGDLLGQSSTSYFGGDGSAVNMSLFVPLAPFGVSSVQLEGAYAIVSLIRPSEYPLSWLSGNFLLYESLCSVYGDTVAQQGGEAGAGQFSLSVTASTYTQMAGRGLTLTADEHTDQGAFFPGTSYTLAILPSTAGIFNASGISTCIAVSGAGSSVEVAMTVSPSFTGPFTVSVTGQRAVNSPKLAYLTAVPYIAAPQVLVNGANRWMLSGQPLASETSFSMPEGFQVQPQWQTGLSGLDLSVVKLSDGSTAAPVLQAGPVGSVGLRAAGYSLKATITDAQHTRSLPSQFYFLFKYPDGAVISSTPLPENVALSSQYVPLSDVDFLAMMEG